jgi:arylsulfatase A-like enzyme
VDWVSAGADKRRSLVQSASYRVALPRRGLLLLSMAAGSPGPEPLLGFFRLTVKVDGTVVAERKLNPRAVPGFRATPIPVEGRGRSSRLELQLELVTGDGAPRPLPSGGWLAVAEPMVLDLDALPDRRGVLLVSIDTLRRDHVGFHGYGKPTTPALDALAAAGTVMDDAVSVSSWTLPAHVSMMTSVEPAAHGAVHSLQGFNRKVPTLPALLRHAGFATHAITSHLYVSPQYGFDEGFDQLDYVYDRKGLDVANRAIEFLDGVGDRPFFLFLHFYDPHWHYAPPDELLKQFETEPYTGTITGSWWQLRNRTKATTSEADLRHLRALYDGEIRYTDDQLARVLRRLRETGRADHTLVVVTSDHGEEFLEHGSWEHQRTLYEEVVRIPMVVRGPGVARGRRVTEPVSLLDVAPTVLDWLGLPGLPAQRGQSVLQPLKAREGYGETDHGDGDTRKLFLRAGAGRWKTILTFDRKTGAAKGAEWFDLSQDPRETRSLPPPAQAAEEIRARLLRRFQDAQGRAGGAVPVELSPEQREQLRALGYLP